MESAYCSDWEHRYDEDIIHNRYHEPMMFPEAALDNKGGFALIGFAECVQCVCEPRVQIVYVNKKPLEFNWLHTS